MSATKASGQDDAHDHQFRLSLADIVLISLTIGLLGTALALQVSVEGQVSSWIREAHQQISEAVRRAYVGWA